MALFSSWCDCETLQNDRKRLLRLTEKAAGRTAIGKSFAGIVRSHYDDAKRIADDIASLGYVKAANILSERLPRSSRAQSGELGEILATELVEEQLGYRVPIRRLRYKDGREMALRGDDFIGLAVGPKNDLLYAKGESKSRANLSKTTIEEARSVLSRDSGRPTPTSILFVVDRLMDRGGGDEALGKAIREEIGNRSIPSSRVEHILFTLSGNMTPKALKEDLENTSNDRSHTSIHVQIEDHQDFIKNSYLEALKLGNS